MKKIILVLVLALLMAGFFIFDLHQFLTLDGIKGSLDQIESWRAEAPLVTAGIYFGIYIAVTALSLPGAAIMTLVGGALFGLGWGLLLVSFATCSPSYLKSQPSFRWPPRSSGASDARWCHPS